MPDTVLVPGASGDTGREVLRYLKKTPHRVVAATRSESTAVALRGPDADEVRVGDLLVEEDAARLVEDCDYAISTVGSAPGPAFLPGRAMVDGEGVANLAAAAEREGLDRVVLTSSIGVGDSREGMPLPVRLFLAPALRAKERGEDALRAADVPHTIVRPGGLTDDPATEDVLVGEGGDSVSGSVPRADVARLLVAALTTKDAKNRTFEVVSRAERRNARNLVDVDWDWP